MAHPPIPGLHGSLARAPREPAIAGDWHPGQSLLDDFVVERLLGEGGMGKVYLVRSRTSRLAFAVKRAKALGDAARRNFLTELQTWIDLPEHPNLVACRFFRTMGDEILIFAEYVEGGSLSDWIRSRKLYEGGPAAALERMLGVAIQFAWGLHYSAPAWPGAPGRKAGQRVDSWRGQEASLEPKVTDYGLARAKAAGSERNIPGLGQSILVSSGGRTPAYCSPEQASGLAVTRKTDIWSWGVSVLEMFTGEVTWASGHLAAEVLEGYLRDRKPDGVIPAMPAGLVEVLRRCFQSDPARRAPNLAEVVEKLKVIYRQTAAVEYGLALVALELETTPRGEVRERRGLRGAILGGPSGVAGAGVACRRTGSGRGGGHCFEANRLTAWGAGGGSGDLRRGATSIRAAGEGGA